MTTENIRATIYLSCLVSAAISDDQIQASTFRLWLSSFKQIASWKS